MFCIVNINFNVIIYVLKFNLKYEISETTFSTVFDQYTSNLLSIMMLHEN